MELRLPPGRKDRHRKQIILFGIAVLFPALILLIYTLHLGRQDRELRRRRAVEAQSTTAQTIGRYLADYLENTSRSLVQSCLDNPDLFTQRHIDRDEIIFIGRIEKGRLHLPWEIGAVEQRETRGPHTDLVKRGQEEEFVKSRLKRAADLYSRAYALANEEGSKNHIRLLEIRAYAKAGSEDKVLDLSRSLLALPFDQSDEYGIPYCLFAAERLLLFPEEIPSVWDRLQDLAKDIHWYPPSVYYLFLDVLSGLEDAASGGASPLPNADLKRWAEQSLSLQGRIEGLAGWAANRAERGNSLERSGKDFYWETSGEEHWIIGLSGLLPDPGKYVVVFDGSQALSEVFREKDKSLFFPGTCHLASEDSVDGFMLDAPFSGLKLMFSEDDPSAWAASSLPTPIIYWMALVLVLSVTAFGMYLLLRDARREMRLAELRSQFVSSVSHELKTPLTSIRMFAESLRIGKPKKPEAQAEYLDTIVGESERLSRLLNNVLDFSKIEQGTRVYAVEPVSLEDVLRDSVKAISFPLKQQGFVLKEELDSSLPEVNGDRDALQQAVLNLLQNAIKFSGQGKEIGLKLYRNNTEAVIDVIDRGIGIQPENREKIFEKYFRELHPGKRMIPGAGLGLTIVGHIVVAHGGRIEVKSEPGQGSTFSIVLPLEGG